MIDDLEFNLVFFFVFVFIFSILGIKISAFLFLRFRFLIPRLSCYYMLFFFILSTYTSRCKGKTHLMWLYWVYTVWDFRKVQYFWRIWHSHHVNICLELEQHVDGKSVSKKLNLLCFRGGLLILDCCVEICCSFF